jgi:hypothetical protein
MSLPDNGDDLHDEMVERIDVGVECPHCHSESTEIVTRDLSGVPLFVCGWHCAMDLAYTDVIRPRDTLYQLVDPPREPTSSAPFNALVMADT